MNNIFSEFEASTESEWKAALLQALKGPSIEEALHYSDPIERIEYTAYVHPSHATPSDEIPGEMSYKRGGKFKANTFEIVAILPSGSAEQRNRRALELLMKGSTSLRIDLNNHTVEECNQLIRGIGFEFIITTFLCNTPEQFEWVKSLRTPTNCGRIHVFYTGNETYIDGTRTQLIDGTQVTNVGGNCTEEIAYLLHEGHRQLFQFIEQGVSIDDAAAQLKFRIGIGSNYFFQIAKIRAFRRLWSAIIAEYQPAHSCSHIAYLEAETTSVNKSVKDPYTNLLRLTTEALSAIIGGVDELTVLPYDWGTRSPELEKSQRLATNISLILKEEAYLEKVLDPGGGAYALESLTDALIEKSWKQFQETEVNGLESLKKQVAATCALRKTFFEQGKTTLIGVNKFQNPEKITNEWLNSKQLVFGPDLILERDVSSVNA